MRLLKNRGGWTFLALAVLLALPFAARPAAAQESTLDKGPAPPYVEPAPPPEPPKPVFDPLRANKSIEVGTFYMKRGNYDAAIDRFHDATEFEPGMAKSYVLLGEAYEHKGDAENALAAYRKYLNLRRDAPDREKIQKKIEKLESQSGREAESKDKSG
jgi:tetratricopeptide (TPR) repeat protein